MRGIEGVVLYIWSGKRPLNLVRRRHLLNMLRTGSLLNLARRKFLLNMHNITPLWRQLDMSSNCRRREVRPFPITS
jgi:hypothetical protein